MIPTQDKPDTTRLQNLSVEVVLFVFASFFSLLAVCVSDGCSVVPIPCVSIDVSTIFHNQIRNFSRIVANSAFSGLLASGFLLRKSCKSVDRPPVRRSDARFCRHDTDARPTDNGSRQSSLPLLVSMFFVVLPCGQCIAYCGLVNNNAQRAAPDRVRLFPGCVCACCRSQAMTVLMLSVLQCITPQVGTISQLI